MKLFVYSDEAYIIKEALLDGRKKENLELLEKLKDQYDLFDPHQS